MHLDRLPRSVILLCLTLAALALATRGPALSQYRAADLDTPWVAHMGGFTSLGDVTALSPTNINAAGSNLVHSDGERWWAVDGREVPGPFAAVDFASLDDGWAVGYEAVASFRGGHWSDPVPMRGLQLTDVDLVGSAKGWAVGWNAATNSAAITELKADNWEPVQIAGEIPHVLHGVWLAPAGDDGWAVGDTGVVHFDGVTWTGMRPAGISGLNAIAGAGPVDVWAVGGPEPSPFAQPGPALIAHYDGTRWSLVHDAPLGGLAAVAIGASDGYAISFEGIVLRLRDGKWTNLGKLLDASRIHRVTAAALVPGTTHVLVTVADGRVYQLDDGRATLVWDNLAFTGIAMVRPNLGWAVSRGGAVEYDGERWTALDASSVLQRANDVAALAADDAWAVGLDGLIAHFDGNGWQPVASPVTVDLDRVRLVSPTLGWAVGNGVAGTRAAPIALSVVLRYDGHAWSVVWDKASADYRPLFDVHGTTADDAWLADAEGLWHYDGIDWRQHPIEHCCYSIAMAGPTAGWAGSDRGILRLEGSEWVEDTVVPAQIHAIALDQDGSGWASGWSGFVAYFDRTAWRLVRGPTGLSGTPWVLRRLALSRDGESTRIWVAGEPRTILTADKSALLQRPPITPYPGETQVPFTVLPPDTPTVTASSTATTTPAVRPLNLPWLQAGQP